MARLTPEQYKKLLDSGLTPAQVQQIAAKRGDIVPSPTLLGALVEPIVRAGTRFGQAVGAVGASALGASPESVQKATEEPEY